MIEKIDNKKEYRRNYMKMWRIKNPEKNKEQRKKYKKSEKGKLANKKYQEKYSKKRYANLTEDERKIVLEYHRNRYAKNPWKNKQSKNYIKDYIKQYNKNEENHRKYLVRQKDRRIIREKLLENEGFCKLCGSIENLEIHHKDYSKNLRVILLCRKCHRELHRKINKFDEKGGKNGED